MFEATKNGNLLLSLMFQTKRQIIGALKKEKKLNFLSFLQAETLDFIENQAKPTMKEVAAFLCITPPSTTSIIDGLVNLNLLERIADEQDRRIIRLSVTPAGKNLIQQHYQEIKEQMEKVLNILSEDEQLQLINIYQKINKLYSI